MENWTPELWAMLRRGFSALSEEQKVDLLEGLITRTDEEEFLYMISLHPPQAMYSEAAPQWEQEPELDNEKTVIEILLSASEPAWCFLPCNS